MRVGISLLTLVPGLSGGSETYARGLCRALAGRPDADAVAFVPSIAPDAGQGLPTEVVDEYRASARTAARALAMSRAALAPGSIRRRYTGVEVVHYPLTVPLPRLGVPTVVTLHDVQHLDLPDNFSRGERVFRRLGYDRAARRADAVVMVSDFVRRRAVELLGLPAARVHVIPQGVDHALFRPDDGPREDILLYPARPWPHKNHARLFEAFRLLRGRRPGLRLVLTGAGLERLGPLPDGVVCRGAVTPDELAGLYRRASCLVFPSRYEGFGLPVLEAMASGCPVAASSAGAIPEVAGEAAVLFDPDDAEAVAAGVLEALAHADELRRRGLEQAARWTWDACADAHLSVYASLAA